MKSSAGTTVSISKYPIILTKMVKKKGTCAPKKVKATVPIAF
jgi:hypothetical protein